ncbi:MAG TPA: radical SAM protein [Pyrinomonadaceae bacterium]|nr:radical SAM protein [Pyrinomonadaceae bacterium]
MKIGFVEQSFEKLAVECLMSVCREAGAEVELIVDPTLFSDSFYENNFLKRLFDARHRIVDRILQADLDLVAFSVVSDDYLWATSIASLVKQQRDIPTVFGGVHPTAVPEYVAADPSVDYVCQGEGEEALINLMDCLSSGRSPENVLNLCFYKGSRLIKNELKALETDLDRLPFPDKDQYYEQMPVMRKFYMTITSRYCPFRCTFCYNSMTRDLYAGKGKYLRQRSPENVIQELENAKRFGYEYVLFNDDILPFNRRWLREFAPLYKRKIGKPFFAYFHPQYADEEIVRLMADAGCVTANMGIQSIDPAVRRDLFDRMETQQEISNSIRTIRQRNVHLNVGHIIGFPGDTASIEEEGVRFYLENPPSFIGCYWLRLYPGTKITNDLLKAGELTADEIAQINRGEGKSFWLGGSVKNMRDIRPFSILYNILPYVPKALIKFFLTNERYQVLRWLPFSFVTVTARAAQALANIKDIYGRWGLYLFVGRIQLHAKHLWNSRRTAPSLTPSEPVSVTLLRSNQNNLTSTKPANDLLTGPFVQIGRSSSVSVAEKRYESRG